MSSNFRNDEIDMLRGFSILSVSHSSLLLYSYGVIMNLFQKMAIAKQSEIADLKRHNIDYSKLKPSENSFVAALSGTTIKIIAEIKRGSPTSLSSNALDLQKIIKTYNQCAAAISIVTEKQFFSGQIADLTYTTKYSQKPILIKDVILDKIQIDWYRQQGSNAILLNANLLAKPQLQDLSAHIISYGMDPFIEVHNLAELETVLEIGTKIIAIHNVDPDTFKIDKNVTRHIFEQINTKNIEDRIIVYASGIKSIDDLQEIKKIECIKAVLIGTAFMSNLQSIQDFKKILQG